MWQPKATHVITILSRKTIWRCHAPSQTLFEQQLSVYLNSMSMITTFRKSSLFFFVFGFAFFRKTEKNFYFVDFIINNDFLKVVVTFFCFCLCSFFRRTEISISRHRPRPRLCCELAGFCCEGWNWL